MERRSCNRKSVEVRVYLSDGQNGVSRCTATDISANGIFLKTNPLYVPRHKCLKLMFALRVHSSFVSAHSGVPLIREPIGDSSRLCAQNSRRRVAPGQTTPCSEPSAWAAVLIVTGSSS